MSKVGDPCAYAAQHGCKAPISKGGIGAGACSPHALLFAQLIDGTVTIETHDALAGEPIGEMLDALLYLPLAPLDRALASNMLAGIALLELRKGAGGGPAR